MLTLTLTLTAVKQYVDSPLKGVDIIKLEHCLPSVQILGFVYVRLDIFPLTIAGVKCHIHMNILANNAKISAICIHSLQYNIEFLNSMLLFTLNRVSVQ